MLKRQNEHPECSPVLNPILLHKNDERVVILNAIDQSKGLVGGDTVLPHDLKSVARILTNPTMSF